MEEKIKENSQKQNEILNENLIRQMEERFDKNKEETNENFTSEFHLAMGTCYGCLLYTSP